MTRKTTVGMVVCASLAAALVGGTALARGFGGGRGGGGGGFRGGGESRGGYGGASSFGRTPSFSSAGSFNRAGEFGAGSGYGTRGAYEGMNGGRIDYGTRSGSYTTNRGGTIDYGAAGAAGRGPGGGVAGRGVAGAQVTTAGGRTFTDVGRAGGAIGPNGNAVAGRSNLAVASGPRGTAVAGSRGFAASGANGAVAGRTSGAAAFRPNGYNAYGGYHAGWVHGYWNGHNDAAWHNPAWGAWGLGVGMGLGWGLSSWGYGSSLYGMGYSSYANPYYDATVVANQAAGFGPYDYSQPIDTSAAPAAESVADPAMTLFDAGRAAFMKADYAGALGKTNEALATLPNDTTLHEFRALCLFALGRYDESAATLYAVLAVGPGWDWTTLLGLYPSIDVYTAQLRALEAYCGANQGSATARFVLAYHYLTQGHTDAAVTMLKEVVALKPGDALSAKLVRQLDRPKDAPTNAAPAPAAAAPQGASIAGTWSAKPSADTSIALTVQPGGTFAWKVTQKGKSHEFSGSSTYGDGILTLAQAQGPALVGRVAWADANHMTFRIVGDGPDDPGLSFSK